MHRIARTARTIGRRRIVAAAAVGAAFAYSVGQADQDELLDHRSIQIHSAGDLADDGEGIVGVGDVENRIATVRLSRIAGGQADEDLVVAA
ncbi:hypothetical protein D3C87_1803830 [compost metagenome]